MGRYSEIARNHLRSASASADEIASMSNVSVNCRMSLTVATRIAQAVVYALLTIAAAIDNK